MTALLEMQRENKHHESTENAKINVVFAFVRVLVSLVLVDPGFGHSPTFGHHRDALHNQKKPVPLREPNDGKYISGTERYKALHRSRALVSEENRTPSRKIPLVCARK
jgi:hypothetical protein